MSEVNTPEAVEVEPLLINDYSRLKSSLQRICYGFGHVYNDLCAAVWFSYTLFYLQIVLEIESSTAGILLMIGQVADSVATPVAGFAVDRIGTRRVWHLAGTIAVAAGFCTMFSMHNNNRSVSLPFLYGFSIIIFQIGWAIVQISHLSIIPEIANDRKHTSDLTTIRYTASVCCSIIVHIITLYILKNATNDKIGPNDFFKFREIALIITCFGVASTFIYHTGTKFTKYRLSDNRGSQQNEMIKHFLKTPVIYQVSLMYMASRLFTTLCLIYMPLYLNELNGRTTNNIDELREKIASVPLMTFLFAFFTSIFLKYTTFSEKIVYINGCILCLFGCLLVGIESNLKVTIYVVASLIGIGSSATMISSLCLTAAFVKINGYDGGIVYSTVTFTDKLISGAVVLLLQYLECTPKNLCPNFYERVLSCVCGCTVIIGLISSMTVQNRSSRSN